MKYEDRYIVGLDLGTTMLKGIIIDCRGDIVSREKIAVEYSRGQNGYVEFSPEDMYGKVTLLIKKLSRTLKDKSKIAGICIASAAGSTILTDSLGNSVYNAISWMDKRVNGEPDNIYGDEAISKVYETTGWPFSPTFPISQLAWIKTYHEEKIKSAAHICTSTDYVCFKMTGKWGIDRSTATSMILQDQKSGKWHKPYLKALGIAESSLSPIYEVGTVLGNVTDESLGLSGSRVILGAFDHSCAALGAGVNDQSQLLLSCGTSWVGFVPVEKREEIISLGLLADSFLYPCGPWGAMFSLPAVSDAINEIIERYISNNENRFEILDRLAEESSSDPREYIIDPTNKIDDFEAEKHTKKEIAGALMIGTALAIKEKMELLHSIGIYPKNIVMVGGPSESAVWREIISETLDMPVLTAYGPWTGAVGAALLGQRTLDADERP